MIRRLLALTLLCAACSGQSTAAEDPESSTTTSIPAATTTSTVATTAATSEASTTTTTEPAETSTTFALPDDPAQKLAAVQLSLGDFGDGYTTSADLEETDPLCDGVDRLSVVQPPEDSSRLQVEGDHLFFSSISVYPTPEEAVRAFDYLTDAYLRCNGGVREAEGDIIQLAATEFSPAAILGSDRSVGLMLEQTSPGFSLLTPVQVVSADRMLIFVGGTDQAVVAEMADVIVGRTRAPAEPVRFTPAGQAAIGPGYADPAYYSFAEGPDELRALPLGEGAQRWLNESSFERVDEVASLSCVLTQTLVEGDSGEVIDAVILEAFGDEDVSGYELQDLGEVYGASNAIYCPLWSEYLLQVIDAIP